MSKSVNIYEDRSGYTALIIHSPKRGVFETKVSTESVPLLRPSTWHVVGGTMAGAPHVRVRRCDEQGASGKKLCTHLPRLLMGAPHGLVVDHINGDTLDNRMSNLRVVTSAENQANRVRLAVNNTSGYRGVSWSTAQKRWRATAQVMGVHYLVGFFRDVHDAGQAIAAWRRENMPGTTE